MKNARRRAREFAVQGLYQWQLTKMPAETIEAQLRENNAFAKADTAYCSELLQQVIELAPALAEKMQPALDRAVSGLDPVEQAVLLLATYELFYHPETPYRVVINEAIELTKTFGGTDGHKYVNGVLDKLVRQHALV